MSLSYAARFQRSERKAPQSDTKGINMYGVVIASGGLDSTVLVHVLHKRRRDRIDLVSFDYGQRHGMRELAAARHLASQLNLRHDVVDLMTLGSLLAGSALTNGDVEVPHGHYAEESMRVTVVPNRNAIMLSIATGAAVARGAAYVATAVHAGDHFIYPDCRPAFINRFSATMQTATEGFHAPGFRVWAPFLGVTKAQIVNQGAEVGVDFGGTYSCYEGKALHCGLCGTCVERREAFQLAGVTDPTIYAEPPKARLA